jgi:hypothetical protein
MPPIEDQRRASATYARTSAFSELDHHLIGHPSPQRGAAAHKRTDLRNEMRLGRTAGWIIYRPGHPSTRYWFGESKLPSGRARMAGRAGGRAVID